MPLCIQITRFFALSEDYMSDKVRELTERLDERTMDQELQLTVGTDK